MEVLLHREPVLLLPCLLLLLLFPDLLRRPRLDLLECVLLFPCLLLQPSRLGGHTGFLLSPQSGLFGLTFLLLGCCDLGV